MESVLLMLNLFMDIMATLLLVMVMVLGMAGMAMESVLLMLNLFMDIMATLLLVMVMVLAMADMAMESVQLMLTLFRDIKYSLFLASAMDMVIDMTMGKKLISHLSYPVKTRLVFCSNIMSQCSDFLLPRIQ